MDLQTIAQIIGVLAMIMNCLSYQRKNAMEILIFQLIGSTLFSINFFMLGAISGALLNCIAIIRAIVFIKKEKLRAEHPLWTVGFVTLYFISYVLIFTLFQKPLTPYNLIVEFVPIIAMILTTISFRYNSKVIRKIGLISSPLWLVYNICSMSIGAICAEIINIISIMVGIIRFDIKKEKNDRENS